MKRQSAVLEAALLLGALRFNGCSRFRSEAQTTPATDGTPDEPEPQP